jgi:hypothetical protein
MLVYYMSYNESRFQPVTLIYVQSPVNGRIITHNSGSDRTIHYVLFFPTSFYLRYSFVYHSKHCYKSTVNIS